MRQKSNEELLHATMKQDDEDLDLDLAEKEREIGRYRDALRRIAKRTAGSDIARICEEALKTDDPDYA